MKKYLQDFNLTMKDSHILMPIHLITLKKKCSTNFGNSKIISFIPKQIRNQCGAFLKIQQKRISQNPLNKSRNENKKGDILVISHKEQRCGIYQYALNITEALKKSSRYNFSYAECSNEGELKTIISKTNPAAIIYNYYPATMPWLTGMITRQFQIPQLGIMHEVTQEEADNADRAMFDFHLCPDLTLKENNPIVFKTKRLIPPYINLKNIPDIITIGSFGFGFGDKGFERIIEIVQKEFDKAIIKLLLPFNDVVDRNGRLFTLATAQRCRHLVTKPGIQLVIKHDFLDKQALLDFLASNTMNAFFYDVNKCRGISSDNRTCSCSAETFGYKQMWNVPTWYFKTNSFNFY